MMRMPVVLSVFACLTACADEPRDPYTILSVAEAEQRIASLDGALVRVRGWLANPCGDLSCAIFQNPVKAGRGWPEGPSLSIASETLAEPLLGEFQGKQVILRGFLSARCRKPDRKCTDRSPDITPTDINLVELVKGR